MECPNCTFQNAPGHKMCLRCNGLLDFSGVAIEPPRAGHGRLARRVRSAGAPAAHLLAGSATDVARAIRFPIATGVQLSDLAWSILPGLAQIRRGPRILGWTLLSVWLAVLLLAAAFMGTAFSRLLCLLAVSLHCLAISLLLNATLTSLPLVRRAAFGLVLYGVLLLGVYRPINAAGRMVFATLQVSQIRKGAEIANGDVVLYTGSLTRPASFGRGDLVVYEIDQSRTNGALIRSGLGIERVIGVPGDEVVVDRGRLWVNGDEAPPELCPLGGVRSLPSMTLTAGEGQYVVFPSVLQYAGHGYGAGILNAMMSRLSIVHGDHIRGRVFWRASPWSKMGVPGKEAAT
jgi:hypothetical protein